MYGAASAPLKVALAPENTAAASTRVSAAWRCPRP